MKSLLFRFPFGYRIGLALLLGVSAIILSGLVYGLVPIKPYFPFVGEVFLIGATWLLYRTDGQSLSALGLTLAPRNIGFLVGGLAIGMLAVLSVTGLRTLYTGEVWHLSSAVDAKAVLNSLYYILPTVMVQELMFRGYLFTKTISRYGVVKANVLFAVLFMLVHVLDQTVWQNPAQMIFLFVSIPVGHVWFATGLLRSKTLLFPIGLHWGNNWAVQHLAGTTDNPLSFFFLSQQQAFTSWSSFVVVLVIFNLFFLAVILLTWRWLRPRAASAVAGSPVA